MKTLFIVELQGGNYQELTNRDGRLIDAGPCFPDLSAVYTYARMGGYEDICIVAGIVRLTGGIKN